MERRVKLFFSILALSCLVFYVVDGNAKTKSINFSIEKAGHDTFKVDYDSIGLGKGTAVIIADKEFKAVPKDSLNLGNISKVSLKFDEKYVPPSRPIKINLLIYLSPYSITATTLSNFMNDSSISLKKPNGETITIKCKPGSAPNLPGRELVYSRGRGESPYLFLTFAADKLFKLPKGKNEFTWKSGDVISDPLAVEVK